MTKEQLKQDEKDFKESIKLLGEIKKYEIFEINTGEYEDRVNFICIASKDFNFDTLLKRRPKKKRNFDNFGKFLEKNGYCEFMHIKNFYVEQ